MGGQLATDATVLMSGSGFVGATTAGLSQRMDQSESQALLDMGVSVTAYGATGDGVTDDTAAVQAALTAEQNIYIPPGTYICDDLTIINNGTRLHGCGRSSILKYKAGETGVLLTTGTNRVVLENFAMDGGISSTMAGTAVSPANRTGLSIATQQHSHVKSVAIYGFGLWGVLNSDGSRDRLTHTTIVDLDISYCWGAIKLTATAEYVLLSQMDIHSCYWGLHIIAGNVSVSNCKINDNTVGVYVQKAGNSNDSHGNVSACMINHCSYAIWCEEVTFGMNFTGCCVFEGIVLLDRANGVNICSGIFDPASVQLRGGGRNYIRNNYLPGDYLTTITHNYQSVTDDTVVVDNYYSDGSFEESTAAYTPQATEIETIVNESTETIDFTAGDMQSVSLYAATANVTLAFTAPAGPRTLPLLVKQGSIARDITWPASVSWCDTEPTWSSDTNAVRCVELRFDGTTYWATASGAVAWTPPDVEVPQLISGLALWLRADDGPKTSSVAAVDGGSVDEWLSKEGSSYSFTQSTPGKKPTYDADGVGGQASVNFDGGDILTVASKVLNSNTGTMFAVFYLNTSPTDYQTIYSQGTGTAGEYTTILARYTAATPVMAIDQNPPFATKGGSTSLVHSTAYAIMMRTNGTAHEFEVNGAAETEQNLYGTPAGEWFSDAATSRSSIGGLSYNVDTFFLKGRIAEIIAYSRNIDDTERGQIETYLNGRYGITF